MNLPTEPDSPPRCVMTVRETTESEGRGSRRGLLAVDEPGHGAAVALDGNPGDTCQHDGDELLPVLAGLEVCDAQVEDFGLTSRIEVEDQSPHKDPSPRQSQLLCVQNPASRVTPALVPPADRLP